MRNRFNNILTKYQKCVSKLESQEETNLRYDEIKSQKEQALDLSMNIETYLSYLTNILKVSKDKDTKFKNQRLKVMQDLINSDMNYIFPAENIKVKLDYNPYRGKEKAKLVMVDKFSKEHDVEIFSSGLMKQLITFSGSIAVSKFLRSNTILVDEAFGASAPQNKEKIGKILKNYVDSGFQILLISQEPKLYNDLERRQINLVKEEDQAKLISIEDFGGDK